MNDTTTQRLHAARAAVDETTAALEAINRRMAEVTATGERRRQLVQQVAAQTAAPRQERRSLFSRILRRGSAPSAQEQARLDELAKQALAVAADDAARAAQEAEDEAQAAAEVYAELQREAEEIHARRPALLRELAAAQFEAAGVELREQALPEFLAAADAFRAAYGRLCGLGRAHVELFRIARERYGADTGSAVGSDRPTARLVIPVLGFEIEHTLRGVGEASPVQGHSINNLMLDASQDIEGTAKQALARWLQA